ncbi:DUF2236 domain-containing protein [Pendulispora rubella]|uniref:DUF2236 domain-containing protein n=1 Tax=Pendulispora rubella TaxID=2741070 RepID=A0ABZ2LAS6_9BACT
MIDVADTTSVPTRWHDPFDPAPWAKRVVWYFGSRGLRADHPFLRTLQEALLQGDPRMDEVVAWMERVGQAEARKLFETALRKGIGALDQEPPEPLARLFAQLDSVPAWVDKEKLRYACATIHRAGPANDYALGCGSLMSGYLSSAAVKPLMRTGALTGNAARRIVETGKFILDITESGDLGRHTAGFETTVRVRLLHAMVRAKLRRSPEWRTQEWGLPINQNDLLGTNLQFSVTYLLTLRFMGFLHSQRERDSIVHFWRYVGYLMGIDEHLLPRNFREATRYLRLVGTSQPDPDEDSRALAAALLDAPLGLALHPIVSRIVRVDRAFRAGLSRSIMGGVAADALGLPNDRWKYAVFALSPTVSALELMQRLVPGGRQAAVRVGRRVLRRKLGRALEATAGKRMHL